MHGKPGINISRDEHDMTNINKKYVKNYYKLTNDKFVESYRLTWLKIPLRLPRYVSM